MMSPIGLNELFPSLGNTIAVEFDTILDVEFHDPNGNHYLQLQYLFTKECAIVIHACREVEFQALQQEVLLLLLNFKFNCSNATGISVEKTHEIALILKLTSASKIRTQNFTGWI